MAVNEDLVQERMAEVASIATDAVKEYLESRGEHTVDDHKVARIASSTLATFTRMQQTSTARDALSYNMARDIAGDSEKLGEYIRDSMPNHPVTKALLPPSRRR